MWSVAVSPGQAALRPNEFYIAMRAVALAQSGEASLTRERLRETATNSVAVAKFKGLPEPPISSSNGKKQPPLPKQTAVVSKKTKGATKGAVATAKSKKDENGAAHPGDAGANTAGRNKDRALEASATAIKKTKSNKEGDNTKSLPAEAKIKRGSQKRRDGNDSGSLSSSAVDSESDEDASLSGGDGSESEKSNKSAGSGHRDSDDGGRSGGENSGARGSRDNDDDGGGRGSGSGSDSDSGADSSKSLDGGNERMKSASVVNGEEAGADNQGSKRATTSRSPSSSTSSSSSSSSDQGSAGEGGGEEEEKEEGQDLFIMTDKARVRYKVGDAALYVFLSRSLRAFHSACFCKGFHSVSRAVDAVPQARLPLTKVFGMQYRCEKEDMIRPSGRTCELPAAIGAMCIRATAQLTALHRFRAFASVGKCELSTSLSRTSTGVFQSRASALCYHFVGSVNVFEQEIFSKMDAVGAGYLSGSQAAGLLAKSGLGKTALGAIWR